MAWAWLDGAEHSSGYVEVTIDKKTHKLHRLIAEAFGLERERRNQITIDHIDGDKSNNKLDNLRWASRREQSLYMHKKNLQLRKVKATKPVFAWRAGSEECIYFWSISAAAKELEVQSNAICKSIRSGETVGGFTFELERVEPAESLPGEEWRSVKGTESAVSNMGRYRNSSGKVRWPVAKTSGYVEVSIKNKMWAMHRLIAEVFELERTRPDQVTIDHIDGDRSNNKLENLRWASRREQNLFAHERNRQRRETVAAYHSKIISAYGVRSQIWAQFPSINAAARDLNVTTAHVYKAIDTGRTVNGFILQFKQVRPEVHLPNEIWRDVILS